jgi:hypothetical protein
VRGMTLGERFARRPSMHSQTTTVNFFISGERFELWENPDQPFGWSGDDMRNYALRADWELLFNALTLAAALELQRS